jgi:hypothetical protein
MQRGRRIPLYACCSVPSSCSPAPCRCVIGWQLWCWKQVVQPCSEQAQRCGCQQLCSALPSGSGGGNGL